MIKVKKFFQFVGVVIAGMVGVIVSALICSNILSFLGIMNSTFGKIVLTWVSMLIGFGIIPTYILKKYNSFTMLEVGIGPISRMEVIICISALSITIMYIIIERNISSIILLTVAILQNIGIAIFEEYFTKGILYYSLKKITCKKIVILLVCSCVFAFVLHSSGNFVTNLAPPRD